MKKSLLLLVSAALCAGFSSCSDDNQPAQQLPHEISIINEYPEGFDTGSATALSVTFTELNTRDTYTLTSDAASESLTFLLPTGTYDYTGIITYTTTLSDNSDKTLQLRSIGSSVTVTGPTTLTLDWFMANAASDLIISEIYAAGSKNAAGTSGLRDAFIRIYNNSDHTLYADGLAIVESDFVNSRSNDYDILTPANDRNINFTVGAVWVIPGSGSDVAIEPGEYITLTDQAIDWSTQVEGALDLTGANFEWYDDVAQDTDNPSVANLDKWFSYSKTVWMMSNQCNRSYALVKFPEGMTVDKYLAEYKGSYDYLHPTTGTQMRKENAYLIPNNWIIDGVNLSNKEVFVRGALAVSIDASYASISDINGDKQRFGKKFIRKTAAVTPDGRKILQDSDDSAADFILVSANN